MSTICTVRIMNRIWIVNLERIQDQGIQHLSGVIDNKTKVHVNIKLNTTYN